MSHDLRGRVMTLRDELRSTPGMGWLVQRLDAILDPPSPAACLACLDRGIVPDFQNWDYGHGEPYPKPCECRKLSVCELPHESLAEEEACERQRLLSEGVMQVPEGVRSRYSDEYLRKINQGGPRATGAS